MSLLLLLLIPPFAVALTPGNITRGSSLTPLGDATSWVSPSGDFAIGFRRLETDGSLFLLAVWFTKPPNQAVVWAANRNQPVQAGSRLELRADGSLVLTDHAGAEVWSPSTGGGNVSHALILDSGNFVLESAGSPDYAWESFSEPMDTILPSQVLPHGRQLTSRLMESDYSDGRFLLRVQEDGNLVFYTYDGPSCPKGVQCVPNNPYWASDTVGDGQQLVFSSDSDVSFFMANGSSVNLTSAKSIYSPKEFYQRATLDPDGVLRHYVYPRNGNDGYWTVAASLPSDICVSLLTFVGSGVCGYNSYCIPDGTTPTMNCECPPQYSFVDPARKSKGCKADFAPQSCDADEGGGVPVGEFRIERKPGIDWPYNDYEHLQPMSEEQCSSACLRDCFCAVAIHRRDECWKKRLPLSNGRYDTRDVGTALLKVANRKRTRLIVSGPVVLQLK
ncbi:hypothetical protein Taro_028990 [Colocasia esculenta]|uniref:Bulb-type lectin domain-containing protein n=1 Tax=Colocasia esculenta TaxID=4460 RepID=A0A843VMP9_COLES|nr:hypothetical protein [Colocasia esculenta]